MSCMFWILLYAVIGFICYIVAATAYELDVRKEKKESDIGTYMQLTLVGIFWPPCVLIALVVLIMIGLMVLCKKIADYIESLEQEPPKIDDKDANKIK